MSGVPPADYQKALDENSKTAFDTWKVQQNANLDQTTREGWQRIAERVARGGN